MKKNPQWKWNFYYYSEKNPVYRCSLSNDTCTSISSKCLYPEKAIQFIELAHTNENYYDLLRYGVEGINYEKKTEKFCMKIFLPKIATHLGQDFQIYLWKNRLFFQMNIGIHW